ncbi:MAG: hypothetical protein PHE17_12575 [Thiothrix sp.]|uniref:hypothetical protein n=1 Tax=Thiothrix sp. TaxID=1032 RepID=UPI00262C0AE2|nr:hypothetical protein [Thiothrix sp.]MDD5393846.1 hypothetical protein [Thiothrix sp.]
MKSFIPSLLISAALLFAVNTAPCWAEDEEDGEAYNAAVGVESTSGDAVGYANSGDYEDAAASAGAGFDTAADPIPPVDLSGCDPHCTVDPADLKQYDPPQPSLKPSYVPPLWPSE